jgi:uridine kinase
MKICICICGLYRSTSLVINRFDKIFCNDNIDYILSISESTDDEYVNTLKKYKSSNIIKKLIVKDHSNNNFRNSVNYSNKLVHSIKLINNKYDIYIIVRSDLIVEPFNIDMLCDDKIYFSSNNVNSYSNNTNRINDNIIITRDYKLLTELLSLHEFSQQNKNYLDVNLYEYLKKYSIHYELINIEYKLILSECNIIAIGGDSGSGKTTLSKILNLLFKKDVCLLETDRYHKWERGDVNYKKYTHLNPNANQLEIMNEDIFQMKIGKDIFQVDYDHSSGKFTQKQKIKNKTNLIVCGLHTLYQENTNELLNLKIYLDTDRELIKKWKIQRDITERGYTLEKVLNQLKEREKDYNEFILKQKDNADIVIQFYETVDKLECNFIIKNYVLKQKIIDQIIGCNYQINYDTDNNLIIKLKNSIEHLDEKIINIIENHPVLFRNNYYKEILYIIYNI